MKSWQFACRATSSISAMEGKEGGPEGGREDEVEKEGSLWAARRP